MRRNPSIYLSVVSILMITLATNCQTQVYVVTNEVMNHAILARMEAVEEGMQGNLSEARNLVIAARDLDPYQLETRLILKIFDDLEAGLIDRPTAIYLFSAIGQIGDRDQPKTERSVSGLQSVGPQYSLSRLISGRISALAGNPEQALERYDRVIATDPAIPIAYLWRAELLREQSKPEIAINDLISCLDLAPFSYQINFALGSTWLELGDHEIAVCYFEKTLTVQPEYAYLLQPNLEICAAYNGRGLKATKAGDPQRALTDFDRAIQLNPRFGEFYLNRGIAHRMTGNINGALKDFDRAVILDAKYIEAYFNRGLLFMQMDYYGAAIKDFERVLGYDRGHIGARYQIGTIYFNQEKYQTAVTVLDSLLKYRPDHYRAVYTRAVALDELRHYRQAAVAYESFFAMAPDSLYDHKIKAWERARLIRKVLHEKYGEY